MKEGERDREREGEEGREGEDGEEEVWPRRKVQALERYSPKGCTHAHFIYRKRGENLLPEDAI